MSDLLYLLRWLRRDGFVVEVHRTGVTRTWVATASAVKHTGISSAYGRTPLRALRALAQQLKEQDR